MPGPGLSASPAADWTTEDAWIGTDRSIRAYKGWDELELLVREACLQSAATG